MSRRRPGGERKVKDNIEPITLANVAGGYLEDAFQDAKNVAVRELNRAHSGIYNPKDKEVSAEVTMKVRFGLNIETGLVVVSGGVTAITLPRRTRRGAVAFLAGESLQVEKSRQSDLPLEVDLDELEEGK
jgi:hypothetical protein